MGEIVLKLDAGWMIAGVIERVILSHPEFGLPYLENALFHNGTLCVNRSVTMLNSVYCWLRWESRGNWLFIESIDRNNVIMLEMIFRPNERQKRKNAANFSHHLPDSLVQFALFVSTR